VFMTTIALQPGGVVRMPAPSGRNVFLYVARGEITIDGVVGRQHHLIELDDGDAVEIRAEMDAVILFGHAEPIGEPVVAHGPFVMNTSEEIVQAITDYNAGKFGKIEA
jgi:redox-sensitive bicupin YhaK (pirin superfamily)